MCSKSVGGTFLLLCTISTTLFFCTKFQNRKSYSSSLNQRLCHTKSPLHPDVSLLPHPHRTLSLHLRTFFPLLWHTVTVRRLPSIKQNVSFSYSTFLAFSTSATGIALVFFSNPSSPLSSLSLSLSSTVKAKGESLRQLLAAQPAECPNTASTFTRSACTQRTERRPPSSGPTVPDDLCGHSFVPCQDTVSEILTNVCACECV